MLVIGAGFGGLAAAYELSKDGLADVTVLEKADDVGGVWRENTYPGAACDVPSNLYSYSFARKTNWGRRYAEQPDILGYIRDTADRFGLRDLVRTGVEVTSAAYDDGTATWRVTTSGGEVVEADVLVPAVGQLSRPALPAIPGLDLFEGPSFHSAQWRHDVDLTGKRVAVLGTGASAIQFVPRIREAARHVTVFQRSAPYVIPKPDRAYTAAHHAAFRRVPGFAAAMRQLIWEISEFFGLALTKVAPLARLIGVVASLNIKRHIKDRALRAKVTPDYPIGCKRVLFSSEWYPALARDNVSVETGAITEVTATGVRTADGSLHEADVIIYGTGFKATEFLVPMTITGRDGRDLHAQWARGAARPPRHGRARLPQHVPDLRPEHQSRQQFDHPDDGTAGPLHPPDHRAPRARRHGSRVRSVAQRRAGLRHRDPVPSRQRRVDHLRLLVPHRLRPGHHQLARPGSRISAPRKDGRVLRLHGGAAPIRSRGGSRGNRRMTSFDYVRGG